MPDLHLCRFLLSIEFNTNYLSAFKWHDNCAKIFTINITYNHKIYFKINRENTKKNSCT